MSDFTNKKPNEHLFQFVETKLNDGTFIFDDSEALIEYEVANNRKGQTDTFGAPIEEDQDSGIYINAAILIGDNGQPTDEDVFGLLSTEALESIRSEISSILN